MASPLNLPKYTFLNAPRNSGKTTLIAEIQKVDLETCVVAFSEPIRQSLLSMFYPDQIYAPHSGFDLRKQEVKFRLLPIPNAAGQPVTIRDWMIWFGHQMHTAHGPTVFGDLALRTCDENELHYPRFLLDGCRTMGDITPFLAHNPHDCLVIHIERRGTSWNGDLGGLLTSIDTGCRHITIQNDDTPAQMVRQLERLATGTTGATV